jgi:hypothetical protein
VNKQTAETGSKYLALQGLFDQKNCTDVVRFYSFPVKQENICNVRSTAITELP